MPRQGVKGAYAAHVNSIDPDQPAKLCNLIRAFIERQNVLQQPIIL